MKFPFFLFLLVISTYCTAQEDTIKKERLCPNTFTIVKNNKSYTLPIGSNHSITERNKKIKRLVIYIHGARRNGLDYFEWGDNAVKSAGKNEETLLIVPQFMTENDLDAHNLDAQHLFWLKNDWRSGDESISSKSRVMTEFFSSYALVDSMIAQVYNSRLFPKLKKVVVIGHSAGGQFVQRYAGMTPMPNILRGCKFKYIVMNSSSYVYFDDRRPVKTETALTFSKPNATDCPDFNTYPKGFDNLNPYAAKTGGENIKQQFLARNIVFLLGGNDTNMNDSSLDKSCSGKLQGRFRLERGLFFYDYVQTFSKKGKILKMAVVPDVAHDGDKMINNDITKKYLFD